ncbi:MAG: hypothetical protein M1828_005054 [Chrysothrix sp. TS-e1954]|nr:MAG: hypothetical protein M1828_005054 [Chrysothrix sp. TS-e1954]
MTSSDSSGMREEGAFFLTIVTQSLGIHVNILSLYDFAQSKQVPVFAAGGRRDTHFASSRNALTPPTRFIIRFSRTGDESIMPPRDLPPETTNLVTWKQAESFDGYKGSNWVHWETFFQWFRRRLSRASDLDLEMGR